MASFLPSYFQKRLLRYALTQLDFIDSDKLNLDNLGLTWGQRTVVELKNVAIKVKRIIDLLQLPPSLNLDHASIKVLRLTIPADLHISGIEVEAEGVEVIVGIQLDEDTADAKSTERSSSKTGYTTSSRTSPTSTHDPAGRGSRSQHGHPLEFSQILPTSEDLATSFLESEPRGEREELKNAMRSQSQYLHESTSAGQSEDVGLGMPEGLSLPTFVANFFKGVADRLTVNIKDVNIVLETNTSTSASPNDNTKFMLSTASISVEAVSTSGGQSNHRTIKLDEVQVFVLSNSEYFAESSGLNSPDLAKSRLRLSHPSSRSEASLSQRSHRSLHTSPSLSTSSLGFGIDHEDALLADSDMFLPSLKRFDSPRMFQSEDQTIDGTDHEEHFAESPQSRSASNASLEQESPMEDLTESRLFTHDEAESMYLSAVSSPRMPGGWVNSENGRDHAENDTQDQGLAQSPLAGTRGAGDPSTMSQTGDYEEGSGSGESVLDAELATCHRARILFSSSVSVKIPQNDGQGIRQELQTPQTSLGQSYNPWLSQSTASESMYQSANSSLHRSRVQQSRSSMSRSRSSQSKGGLTVEIGDTSVDLDITICKLLVKTTQRLSKCVPVVPQKTSSSAHAPTLGLPDVSVAKVEISFCGCVPRRPPARLPFQPLEEMLPPDQALLKLSLSPVSFVTDRMTKQCLTVSKILMTHGTRQVLSCLDDVNVRDSLSSSSMLRPHDFVATLIGNRHEIQMKPIHMVLDLLVIDDVLSRSGGLDALLDLGTSMMSTNTVKGQSSPPVIETSRQRAVRFSEPHKPARAESGPMSTSPKVDIRVSGTVLDLIGSESSIQIKTSVIKAVYRENNLRVVVDGAALEGPLLNDSESRGEVNAKIRNIELYYSDVPSDNDLDRLLSLITPSSNSYGEDDDIMVDTLIRQRRRGGVLRLHVADLKAEATGFAWVPHVSKVSDEISRLSYVAKLLPEDDRPGVLIFGLFKKLDARFEVDPGFGSLRLRADLLEGAHISVPSLAAAQVASWNLSRSDTDILIREVTAENSAAMAPPMLMCRFIADEMEPTVKVKLSNTCIEYKVPTVTSVTSLLERLKDKGTSPGRPSSQQSSSESSPSIDAAAMARKIKFSLAFKDCAIALNPDNSVARGLFVLTDATIRHEHQSYGSLENLDIKKASLLIINDEKAVGQSLSNADTKLYFEENDQVQQLTKAGFVPVGSMSSASAVIMVIEDKANKETRIDVEFRNNLLFLETCADSTHILMQILGGLAPPPKPSKYPKYRTEIVPIEDMLASFTGDAFVAEQGPEHGLQASQHADPQGSGSQLQKYDDDNDDDEEEEGLLGDLYQDDADDEMTASYADSHIGQSTLSESVHVGPAGTSDFGDSGSDQSVMASSSLDFRTNHFAPKISVGGTAHRWNTAQDTYSLSADHILQRSPLTVRIRDVHVIWNLFDGYDWQTTRDTIAQTVKDIETKALARRPRSSRRAGGANEDDDESVIGDFLFNSIYIGIPANKDPRELTSAINHDIDDMVSDTSSYATGSTVTAATSRRQSAPAPRQKRLKLNRSRHHKMAFELEGISADFVVFPPGHGEVESSSDIRVKKIEVFDHVPTSTWKKFATYMQDAGEREMDTNMVHVEMLNVRPVADLSATELVLKIGILPLRLHVDQDALDFLTRFFEFKDESTTSSGPPSEPVFLQRVDIGPIPLRLDFKPKRVDYGGLRSGRTTEFMNFVVLDRSDMVLKRVISYGVPGFERLGNTLNNIWTADVKQTQLPGVLAGLAPLRPLVDVTRGVRDLVAVPIREYRKDGRLVRSIQKGAVAFAKTTTTELVNLGAKMAIGSQKVIQDTLDTVEQREERHIGDPDEEARQISLYADQPLGIMQGLRGAYQSLERDLLLAKDAILAVPGEVVASGSAKGAAAAVVKQSPTIILRPALGAAKAIGQTLLGAGNTLDKQNLRRMDEKYKRN